MVFRGLPLVKNTMAAVTLGHACLQSCNFGIHKVGLLFLGGISQGAWCKCPQTKPLTPPPALLVLEHQRYIYAGFKASVGGKVKVSFTPKVTAAAVFSTKGYHIMTT